MLFSYRTRKFGYSIIHCMYVMRKCDLCLLTNDMKCTGDLEPCMQSPIRGDDLY